MNLRRSDSLVDTGPIVIIGAGMAGGVAARTLREEGYNGSVVLVGNEPGLPFGRPPLSKTYLRGEEDLSGWLVAPAEWYRSHDVELIAATATRIDPLQRRVELSTGEALTYQKLLIATGGQNRRFDVPGADLPGVLQLRTVADSDAIRKAAGPGSAAVIVGMGFIGSEVAASLRQLGVDVTAVLRGNAPLDNVLGPEVGELMAGIHRDAGVRMIPQDEVVGFEGAGRLERAVTRKGARIDCTMAVVAVGIAPTVDLLRDTEAGVDDGVLVDARLQTSLPGVFAAGDVANQLHPLFGRIRVEHYNNAEKQGAAAARSMLGSENPYAYIHSFWSDQYDSKIEYVGHARKWDRIVIRGSTKDRAVLGFYLTEGTVAAAVGLNRGGDPELEPGSEMAIAARLVATRARPDPSVLADADGDLATV